jgi:hypothetical protein
MVATDVILNRSTITEMISYAIPVSNSPHQGPASRHRSAPTQGRLSLCSCRVCSLMLISFPS